MTIKKLFILGSVLTGAALLRNKGRRDQLVDSARKLVGALKSEPVAPPPIESSPYTPYGHTH